MNDEIKEILTISGRYITNDEKGLILDYITNLLQENERLKVKTKEQSLLLIDYQDTEQNFNDYKSRCEKASEYIEHRRERVNPEKTIYVNGNDLLNILQNGSDNNV